MKPNCPNHNPQFPIPGAPLHKTRSVKSLHLIALLLIPVVLVLVSCAAPVIKPQDSYQSPENLQATSAFKALNYSKAADLWLKLAQTASNKDAYYYNLRAADARILNQENASAQSLLQRVDRQQIEPRYRALYDVIKGQLFLEAGNSKNAETLLASISTTNSSLQRRAQILLDEARRQQRSPKMQAWESFQQALKSDNINQTDALTLLHLLDPLSSRFLQRQSVRSGGETAGWLDLAVIARSQYPDRDSRVQALASWRSQHPFHPIDEAQAYWLTSQFNASLDIPARVSILLPQNGTLTAFGNAVRDGLLSSYLNSPQKNRSELHFINSSDSTLLASLGNIASRADQIIGPLARSNVNAIERVIPVDFPMLALNLPELSADIEKSATRQLPGPQSGATADNAIPTVKLTASARSVQKPNAVYFPLLPEDEARSAAQQAFAAGARTMIIIAPDTGMGNRQVDAFSSAYHQAGGKIVGSLRYAQNEVDHSARLKQILGVKNSQQRGTELKRILGGEIGFEASVRGDLDAIFLVADPRQGRLIKPQLKFLDAGYLPVYATGMIYSGIPNWRADRDLDGVRISTNKMALQRVINLKNETASTTQISNGKYDRFEALGADSWSILPWLEMLMSNPNMRFSGLSGELWVDADNRVVREPVWGVFKNGKLQALQSEH